MFSLNNFHDISITETSRHKLSSIDAIIILKHTTEGTGFLYFCSDDADLTDNRIRIQHDRPTHYVYYHERYLPIVIDVLGNEKPITFFFNDETLYAGIRTGSEPVGEEEDQD